MAQHKRGERSGASCLPSQSSSAKVHASRWSLRYDIVLRIPLHFIALYTVAVMPLPGRLPTHKDYRVMLLTSDMSKSAVYRFYVKACESEQVSCISRRTFENIWKDLCPTKCKSLDEIS